MGIHFIYLSSQLYERAKECRCIILFVDGNERQKKSRPLKFENFKGSSFIISVLRF